MRFSLPDFKDDNFFTFISGVLMGVHIILMIVYLTIGSYRMAAADLGSIGLYWFSLSALAPKGKHTAVIWLTFFETLTHVIFAVCFLGWRCGFQLWYFGLICAIYLISFAKEFSAKSFYRTLAMCICYSATYWILMLLNLQGKLPRAEIWRVRTISGIHLMNLIITVITLIYMTYAFTRNVDEGQKRLHRRADYDELTGLYNRYLLNYLLDEHIKSAKERKATAFVSIVDIDFFKKVNDTYGHNVGDTVLKQIADHFRGNLRDGESFGRWGGEEFVIMSRPNCDKETFVNVMEGLRNSVARSSFGESGQMLHITISIGVGEYQQGMNAEELIKAADDNLYQAKQTGRNKVVS